MPGDTRASAIRVERLSKRYGGVAAVEDLSFDVRPGAVTGFLGPNGAGKTTTLRILLGLARPSAGEAMIFGQPFAAITDPVRTVGASLEISGFHPGRSGRSHLRSLAVLAGLPSSRVEDVLGLVELTGAADRRAGKYSMGMRQRLALAATLLGDPQLLVLDEPANGLDPQGIRWLRDFLRAMAAEGRTVLISSHVLSEVSQTVDDVIVIHHGRLVDEGPVDRLSGPQRVSVRSPRLADLAAAIERAGAETSSAQDRVLIVSGLDAAQIGDLAFAAGLPLHELAPHAASLEEVFLELTSDEPPPADTQAPA
ncbi:MAG: ABC transporter ATP-binding protein [Actinomycetota bacterium]|nr:ABC transporter ATP-binding protein [Actinomycetota bacterium]